MAGLFHWLRRNERRGATRHKCDYEALAEINGRTIPFVGELSNISRTGCLFRPRVQSFLVAKQVKISGEKFGSYECQAVRVSGKGWHFRFTRSLSYPEIRKIVKGKEPFPIPEMAAAPTSRPFGGRS